MAGFVVLIRSDAVFVTYLAHDLDDPAIWRRVEMLRRGGAQVRVAGFRRGTGRLREAAIVMGETQNGRMVQRVGAIARAWPGISGRLPAPSAADLRFGPEVIIARNLEMLALGRRLQRSRPAPTRLIYELLDIHAMMLGDKPAAKALRSIERGLVRKADLTIISSPAFKREYLDRYRLGDAPTLLIENKPFQRLPSDAAENAAPLGRDGDNGPLVIGWFGVLRCRWSLETLDLLTRTYPGKFRVILRGRPALDVMGNFHELIAANADMSFEGPYQWPDDLSRIYAQVDVAWLIDRYQAGQNSDWLLPNRLYEGALNGAVPVVLAGTEVAHRAEEWRCGVTVPDVNPDTIAAALSGLSQDRLNSRRGAVTDIPRAALEMTDAECHHLTATLCGAPSSLPRASSVRGPALQSG